MSVSDAMGVASQAVSLTNIQSEGQKIDVSEAEMFSGLVNSPQTSTLATLKDVGKALGMELPSAETFEKIRNVSLENVDFSNPMQVMIDMTKYSVEAQNTFAQLHLASGLASSVVGLFGNLLKNQQ